MVFVAVLDIARISLDFEVILGFIGIGVQPPTPTFGTIIADGRHYLINGWWIPTMPGLFLFATLLGINLIGSCVRAGAQQSARRDAMTAGPLLRVSNLRIDLVRDRERTLILDGIDLEVHSGQVLGVLGESGSGKTTLARAMVGCAPLCSESRAEK